MKAYIFPGQGSQFSGMGLDMYKKFKLARELFEMANKILKFDITEKMFHGTNEDLKETKVTQPSIFLYSVILTKVLGDNFQPKMVAGHSLGEWSALVASEVLSFEDGLKLVHKRALAMQKACQLEPSTMAAVLGLDDAVVEEICESVDGVVVAANYNCQGQLVISGEIEAVNKACKILNEKGARRTLMLPVGGAFHSPLMKPAEEELTMAIENTIFRKPICPVYQNVVADEVTEAKEIKNNLIAQLTAPVRWTQSIQQMIADGASKFIEVGPGKVLQGLVSKIDKSVATSGAYLESL